MDEYWDREFERASADTDDLELEPELEYAEQIQDIDPELDADLPFEHEEYDFTLDDLSQEFTGLLTLGKLVKKIDLYGHTFIIRTLKVGEELEVGLIADKYRQTNEAGRAYATAVVAAALERVDGKPPVVPIGPSEDSILQEKYEFVRSRYYWPIVRKLYESYVDLVRQQEEALEELIKK